MDDPRIPGEVSAAAHAFPDHGLASSADLPPVERRTAHPHIDDPEAAGRLWPSGSAGGAVPAAAGGGPYVGSAVPFTRGGGPLAGRSLAGGSGVRTGSDVRTDSGVRHGSGARTGSGTQNSSGLRHADGDVGAGATGVLSAYAAPEDAPGHRSRAGFGGPADHAPLAASDAGAARGDDRAAGRARREVWTDLAVEAIRPPERIPGVAVEEDHRGPLQISRVRIESEEAELRVGKRRGRYITLEAIGLRRRNAALQEDTARTLADELRTFLPDDPDAQILVVGLGNWNATPDALGPRVVGDLLITRHLREQVPEDLRGGLRSLCAVAPGVLGTTGIETGEIIRAIVDRIHPDAMIAVDALASRSIDRIAATIQLADTGIHPGSGVGNDRGDLSAETLGVPVIAIGVPTVVHAFTIASDTVDLLVRRIPRRPEFAGLRTMSAEEKRRLIAEVLTPSVGDLMVTPKEVDVLIEDMSRIIAAGINAAVHPKIAQQPTLF